MSYVKRKEIVVVMFCLLMGFALRFYTFDRKSLWIDEIHTFNDSRDNLRGQIKFYSENPSYLHPPLFFILTYQFYPFTEPERDLRIIPLIFGTLSIPMIYLLAGSFHPAIAIPCSISLTFMTYHISLSQDGRAYSLAMFLGMLSLYLFMRYLKTLQKRYLVLTPFVLGTLFHTSYSAIPFIAFSQILWFYRVNEGNERPRFYSVLILIGFFLSLCTPWLLFLALHYQGQRLLHPYEPQVVFSFLGVASNVLNDWAPRAPLTIVSVIFLTSFPFISKFRTSALILLSLFILPIGGVYLYCKLFDISHFITSRYLINFFPLFLITLYLSISVIEDKFERLKKIVRLRILFVILFVASNLAILPAYYRAEKEDFKALANYLKSNLRKGDKLFASDIAYVPGILHYFGVNPEKRHYEIPYYEVSKNEIEFRKTLVYKGNSYTIYSSQSCCTQYIADKGRLWIIGGSRTLDRIKGNSPCVLKGYFDGSFLNFNRFPTDASIYLFLWDPKSPDEKGIDIPVERN